MAYKAGKIYQWDEKLDYRQNELKMLAAHKERIVEDENAAVEAIRKRKEKLAGIDPKHRYFNQTGMPMTPGLLLEIARLAELKSYWTDTEANELRDLQKEWDATDELLKDWTMSACTRKWQSQFQAEPNTSLQSIVETANFKSLDELKEQASHRRRLLRIHFKACMNSAIPIVCKIYDRLDNAAEKVFTELESKEKKLALSIGFNFVPSNFLIAVGQVTWKLKDSMDQLGIIADSPKSLILMFPGHEKIFK